MSSTRLHETDWDEEVPTPVSTAILASWKCLLDVVEGPNSQQLGLFSHKMHHMYLIKQIKLTNL